MLEGFECFRIHFPKGMDANEYALAVTPAAKSLGLLIRKASWLGKGEPSAQPGAQVQDVQVIAAIAPTSTPEAAPSSLAAVPAENPPAASAPAAEVHAGDEIVISFGERRYRIRGLAKNLAPETLKVNVLASQGEAYHVDAFDLYAARARGAFITNAARELAVREDVIKHDLGRVLLKLEELQAEHIAAAVKVEPTAPVMSEAERAQALAWLQSPDLMARILIDFDAVGLVGEASNKLMGYLAAVSRKLDAPLAIVVQSSSAAGKSSLMDAVLAFMPEEERIKYSAMTGQSLFYMGETNLKHKILAIAEEEGAARASYALKLLQSEGELTIASTGKDPNTGNLITQQYRVEGPVMIFLTTTAIEIDEELLNRCIVLTVDEGRAQTEAIHVRQRAKRTLAGLRGKEGRQRVLSVHRNAQRLLRSLAVVNPWAEQLTFLSDKTRTRRDHEKYLTLDRHHRLAAPAPAAREDAGRRGRRHRVHRGRGQRHCAGQRAGAPGAGREPGRAAAGDAARAGRHRAAGRAAHAGPAVAARGGALHAQGGARGQRPDRHAAARAPGAPGAAGIPPHAPRQPRPELRVRAAV